MEPDLLINGSMRVKPYEKVQLIDRKEEKGCPKIILGRELKLYDHAKIRTYNPIKVHQIKK